VGGAPLYATDAQYFGIRSFVRDRFDMRRLHGDGRLWMVRGLVRVTDDRHTY
jgi:hypothetical protein